MYKTYKYRLYPTAEQMAKIDQTFNACRLVYNLALETKSYAWKAGRINLSRIELQRQTTELISATPWLGQVNSQALYTTLELLDNAYRIFFRGGGHPKFKKSRANDCFLCRGNTRRIDWDKSTLTIPKIKNIPFALSRKFEGAIKTVTITKTVTGKYFASVLVDNKLEPPPKANITECDTIGIDVGIKAFVVTSEGASFRPNQYFKNSMKRLACLQKRAARKKKGGKNKVKANYKVAIVYEKITNQRADYIHKTSTAIIRDNQVGTFAIEDLNISGMLKNRKLSRCIADVSFGEFFRQMKYKCDWYGKNLIIIDRFAPSSKRCSDCGAINHELTLADREWTCSCGSHHDRDLNAAKNIKFFGLNTPVGTRGEPVESRRLRRAKKQEEKHLLPI